MLLRRYLIREVMHQMLVMLLVLLVIMISVIFVRYLSDAATGGMSLATVLNLIGVILPQYIALLIPITLFLSVVLVYGKLQADSEMMVMFACGLSWRQLAMYTMIPGVLLTVIVAFLSLYVVPLMSYHQDNLETISKEKANTLNLVETGRFLSLREGAEVVYIGSSDPRTNESKNIFIYRKLGKQEVQIVLAPTGYMKESGAGKQSLILTNGLAYQGKVSEKNWQLVKFKRYIAKVAHPVSSGQNTDLSAVSTMSLFHHMDSAKGAELQWRLALPLATLVVALLGVAISQISPRTGRYSKLLNALLLFIIYFNALSVGRSWISNGHLSPWLGLWVVHGAFVLFAVVNLYQLERGHWPKLLPRWRQIND